MSTVDKKKTSTPGGTTRRSFLENAGTGWVVFGAAGVAGLGMTTRFFFPNDRFEPTTRFKIGFPNEYAASREGAVDGRWRERYGIWVVRNLEGFYVMSTTCTHLGCQINWLQTERKFKCPCHGSGFFATGINFEGPAPRPLERFKISLAPDGQIQVDKDRMFRHEKGEWEDPESFLPLRYIG